MDIIQEAYTALFPEKPYSFEGIIKYSGRFKGYNANVRLSGKKLVFNLSKEWRGVSRDIKMGLLQELMVKLFKKKVQTYNMDLYNLFLQKIHLAIPKVKTDPVLEVSFNTVNERYFLGFVEKPNLQWGSCSRRKLGSYDYGTDTITISLILKDQDPQLLDYVMYHEMLHKKHKFKSHAGTCRHHTPQFRTAEKVFQNADLMEKQLRQLGSAQKKQPTYSFRKIFSFFK